LAEHREKSQLVGDFLREAAVLVGVLWPLEDGIKNNAVSPTVLFFALFVAIMLLWWGSILEGTDEL
jgi:hypothetical protein